MSVSTAPRWPRAMGQNGTSDSSVSTWEPLFQSVAAKLYPRLALFKALAGFKDAHRQREPSGDVICEARRDFLGSFAYLCDTDKGGATVTAAALQKLLHSNILWLAANEGMDKETISYAERILQKLKELESRPPKAVHEEIFRLVVDRCTPRINFYISKLKMYARNCRMQMRQEMPSERVSDLRSKLKKLAEPPPSMTLADLVDRCHAMRGADIDEIRKRSKKRDDDFRELAHYIGRVGATRSSTNAVVDGMLKVPSLRKISGIRPISAPETREMSVGQGFTSPYEIVWAICKESPYPHPVQMKSALHAVVDFDHPLNGEIRDSLASRPSIVTRVHAELQIADRFSRDRYEFVDGDMYIGCSKPACYFCHRWLGHHKLKFVLPATHDKIIVGCRGPDDDVKNRGVTVLTEMYKKVCGSLNQDILEFLLKVQDGEAQVRHHYMSTEGSSRAPSRI
ncbi:hypothetical protein PV08_07997 [Exophiala spinifera]|uniref:Uncharacterized protein n=1 Tax=Exophiala spinifera TaxID=91928 RepID=A0A0D2B2H1_9EURO|nr:uncharacterized protein PV08_07997 [Exophiala spinifera]KIW12810.1 hypothetical protein PV08_07997 [Exophiala spinifera]